MRFLYALESLRNPVMTAILSAVTFLGSEWLFIAAAIIMYWCVSKKRGYYLMATGFIGTVANQFMKILFQVPRPWVRDPAFTIVESARADAGGYSFPSGHTQNVTSILGGVGRSSKKTWARIASVAVIALVGFSRMYLGVHTSADVGVALLCGLALVFGLWPVFEKSDEAPRYITWVFGATAALSLFCAVYVWLYPWGPAVDADNLGEAVKTLNMMLGCSVAVLIGAPIERKRIDFDTRAPLFAQVLKVLLGLMILVALRVALKPLLGLIFAGRGAANAVRYGLMVLFAILVWPRTFPWFSRGCPVGPRGKKALKIVGIVLLVLGLLAAAALLAARRGDTPVPADAADAIMAELRAAARRL